MSEVNVPLSFSDAAATRVKALIAEEENPELKLRVYITGGGCSGFQYGFTFDESVNEGDTTIVNSGVTLVVDPMSLQYLIGGGWITLKVWKDRAFLSTTRMQPQPVAVERRSACKSQ